MITYSGGTGHEEEVILMKKQVFVPKIKFLMSSCLFSTLEPIYLLNNENFLQLVVISPKKISFSEILLLDISPPIVLIDQLQQQTTYNNE